MNFDYGAPSTAQLLYTRIQLEFSPCRNFGHRSLVNFSKTVGEQSFIPTGNPLKKILEQPQTYFMLSFDYREIDA